MADSVDLPPNHAMSARAERRAMIALLAVFALLVQALVPTLAMAATAADPAMVICTQAGLKAAPAGDAERGHPPADHACQHCLCPALATPPPPANEVRPVAYAVATTTATAVPAAAPLKARAPPRPPGQGPPSSDA